MANDVVHLCAGGYLGLLSSYVVGSFPFSLSRKYAGLKDKKITLTIPIIVSTLDYYWPMLICNDKQSENERDQSQVQYCFS